MPDVSFLVWLGQVDECLTRRASATTTSLLYVWGEREWRERYYNDVEPDAAAAECLTAAGYYRP